MIITARSVEKTPSDSSSESPKKRKDIGLLDAPEINILRASSIQLDAGKKSPRSNSRDSVDVQQYLPDQREKTPEPSFPPEAPDRRRGNKRLQINFQKLGLSSPGDLKGKLIEGKLKDTLS